MKQVREVLLGPVRQAGATEQVAEILCLVVLTAQTM